MTASKMITASDPAHMSSTLNDQDQKLTQRVEVPMPKLTKKPFLMVVSGADIARRYSLLAPEIILGRGSGAHIVFEEQSISRQHARLTPHAQNWLLEDLGSTNGTYINGNRIAAELLTDNDLISIGEIFLKFCLQSEIDIAFHDEIFQAFRNDDLTGLVNRKFFLKKLDAEIIRAERYDKELSLLLCDFDNFKSINDRYGHPVGDLVLHRAGGVIRACVRHHIDVAARLGGEEIAVLLPETGLSAALIVAERIRRTIADLVIQHAGERLDISLSIGVSARSPELCTAADLIASADANLYTAKKKGKNCVAA